MKNHVTNHWSVTIGSAMLIFAGFISFNAFAQDEDGATEEEA